MEQSEKREQKAREFDHTNTAIDLKQKIVISYQKMKAI